MLAKLLKNTKRRDLIVVSFLQAAVDRFHALVPKIDVAPGIAGAAVWIFGGGSPGPGVAAFQVPITFGPDRDHDRRARGPAHRDGYAWQNWFSGDDSDSADSWRTLIDMCVDGTMTAHPRAYERVLRSHPRPKLQRNALAGSRLLRSSAFCFRPSAALPSRKSRTAVSAGPRSSRPSIRPGSASSA